jgi:ADP-heptose:LPS heptosyltransferase
MASDPKRILVVKHGALGDIVLALGPFAAIRAHHEGAHIVLLTTTPFARFLKGCRYFDEIWIDDKPKAWQLGGWLTLRRTLRDGRFERVYDLQHTDRTRMIYRLLGNPRPEWSGIIRGASHPHTNPGRDSMHTIERQAEQLAAAGIAATPETDLAWLPETDTSRFLLADRIALLVPGGSPDRPRKRWPAQRYASLSKWLSARGLQPVLIGTLVESPIIEEIDDRVRGVANLCNDTSLAAIVALARRAEVAIGNDTGPMHLIAAAGCPSLVLFSDDSVPGQTAPRGANVRSLQVPQLEFLAAAKVIAEVSNLVPSIMPPRDADDDDAENGAAS